MSTSPNSFRAWINKIKCRPSCSIPKPKLDVKGLMMAEIFLNALVIAYAIYQTAVAFGWTLLLFDIYNEFNEQTGCPESPALPFFVHGVSATSVVGLFLWICGYLIGFSGKDENKKKDKPDEKTVPVPKIVVTKNNSTNPVASTSAAAYGSITTAAAASSSGTAEDDEDADEATPLVKKESKQLSKLSPFRFTMAHLTCIGVGVVHLVWMAFGTALTIPMYFRLNLFSKDLGSGSCNATIYWFAILIVLLEYLLIFTLAIWFTIDVMIVWRKKAIIINPVQRNHQV